MGMWGLWMSNFLKVQSWLSGSGLRVGAGLVLVRAGPVLRTPSCCCAPSR